MPEPKAQRTAKAAASRKGRADPLTAAAVVFFLMAVAFAAAPAFKAGLTTLAGVLLLIGLSGFAVLGLFVVRGSLAPISEPEPAAQNLIEALNEPAAIAASDGRVKAANLAWKSVMGLSGRLPRTGTSASGLFSALSAAQRGETGRAAIKAGGGKATLNAAVDLTQITDGLKRRQHGGQHGDETAWRHGVTCADGKIDHHRKNDGTKNLDDR